MKNIYLIFAFLVFAQFSLQAQNFIPFQGIALDGSGKALASKKIGIKISISKDNASGTVSYAESHAPTTDNNGLFQINIGSGTALTNTFAAIDWSTLNYFLKLEMDVNGGTSYSLISTTQMGFVPFAFYAKNGGSGSTVTGSGVTIDSKGNTAAGGAKFSAITTGFGNFIFSNNSMAKATTGADNVAIGSGVLLENVSGWANNALGRDALKSNTSGDSNSAFGSYSLLNNVSGRANSSFGNESLRENSTGNYNAGFGNGSLWKNTIGSFNTATGYNALNSNTTGTENTALGYQSLINNSSGISNTAAGSKSMLANIGGNNNVAIGNNSLLNNVSSHSNIALGVNTLVTFKDIGSTYNNAIGEGALLKLSTGNSNDALGSYALQGLTNGTNNIALGKNAGQNIINGANNIVIGTNSTASNSVVSNEITFGDSNIKAIRSAVTSITSLSDARDKKNIQDLSLGLNFIQTLKPRSFQWDKREWYTGNTSDGSKLAKTATAGFIAQELDESQQKFNADWLNLVYKSNPEKLEANYGNLIPIIVKALQELKQENVDLKESNKLLQHEIDKLKVK